MRIVYLRDEPELSPLVARWIWDEWRDLLVQRTFEEFAGWFRGTERGAGLPTTLVLLVDDQAVGTVSLECDDMDIRPDLTPWLASLYVAPDQRGRGYGRALLRAAEAEAQRQGIEELFLYTPAHEGYYRTLGWALVERCLYRETPVSVMARLLE